MYFIYVSSANDVSGVGLGARVTSVTDTESLSLGSKIDQSREIN